MLSKSEIARIYNERRVEVYGGQEPEPEFSTRDFVGFCITGARIVDTERDNPRYLSVLDMSDGSSLVYGVEEMGSGIYSDTHCFWINKNGEDKYSNGRFLVDGDAIVQEVERRFKS